MRRRCLRSRRNWRRDVLCCPELCLAALRILRNLAVLRWRWNRRCSRCENLAKLRRSDCRVRCRRRRFATDRLFLLSLRARRRKRWRLLSRRTSCFSRPISALSRRSARRTVRLSRCRRFAARIPRSFRDTRDARRRDTRRPRRIAARWRRVSRRASLRDAFAAPRVWRPRRRSAWRVRRRERRPTRRVV